MNVKRGKWVSVILLVLTLLASTGCKARYSKPSSTFQDLDLVGTWEASYGRSIDRLILRADGTFKQIYHDTYRQGYIYETTWSKWWIECFPDGRVWLHLQGARFYWEGIRIAELDGMGEPCPTEVPDCLSEHTSWPFYDPIAGESLNMVGELILNVQRDSSGGLVLLHMLLSKDQGFVSLAGTATGFGRVETESPLPTPVETALLATASRELPPSTLTPLPTATPSPTPPRPTLTPTRMPTPSPTLTPLPTLTVQERETRIRELLKTNGDCELPCWWGITPGRTTWAAMRQFIMQYDGGFSYGTGDLDIDDIYIRVVMPEGESVVESIEVDVEGHYNQLVFQEDWEYYSLAQILATYGEPSRVWIQLAAGPVMPGSTMGYGVWLFYDHLGFLVCYGGSGVVVQPIYHVYPTLRGPGGIVSIRLWLQSPDSETSLEELAGVTQEQLPYLRPVEEATGLSAEEFYTLFTQSDGPVCFESPRDMWP